MSEEKKKDENVTFDIYHFFSRKDVIAAAIVIALLLIYLVSKVMMSPTGA